MYFLPDNCIITIYFTVTIEKRQIEKSKTQKKYNAKQPVQILSDQMRNRCPSKNDIQCPSSRDQNRLLHFTILLMNINWRLCLALLCKCQCYLQQQLRAFVFTHPLFPFFYQSNVVRLMLKALMLPTSWSLKLWQFQIVKLFFGWRFYFVTIFSFLTFQNAEKDKYSAKKEKNL